MNQQVSSQSQQGGINKQKLYPGINDERSTRQSNNSRNPTSTYFESQTVEAPVEVFDIALGLLRASNQNGFQQALGYGRNLGPLYVLLRFYEALVLSKNRDTLTSVQDLISLEALAQSYPHQFRGHIQDVFDMMEGHCPARWENAVKSFGSNLQDNLPK